MILNVLLGKNFYFIYTETNFINKIIKCSFIHGFCDYTLHLLSIQI
jgi:hypothetical protein